MNDTTVDMPIGVELQSQNDITNIINVESKNVIDNDLSLSNSNKFYKFSRIPSIIYKNIYQNNEVINNCVSVIVKGAIHVAYKFNDKLTKIIASNPEKYIKLCGYSDNTIIQNNEIYSELISILMNSNIIDIPEFIDGDITREIVEKIKSELYNYNNLNLIKCDLRNSLAVRPTKYLNLKDTIIFKVVPFIDKMLNSGISEYSLNPNLITCKYRIDFDFISLVTFMINNCNYPKINEEVLGEEEFINENMNKFGTLVSDLSNRIIIELIDRIEDINNNFDNFNKKSAILCRDILNSQDSSNVIRKVRFLMRSHIGTNVNIDKDVVLNKAFNKIDDREYLSDILKKLQTSSSSSLYTGILSIDLSYILNNKDNIDKVIDNMNVCLYEAAFSQFFENKIILNYNQYSLNYNSIIKTSSVTYTRDFDKKYDLSSLYLNAGKIEDYNLRDFYQESIRVFKKNSVFAPLSSIKFQNGEKETFLINKAQRFMVLYGLAFGMFLKRVYEYTQLLYQNDATGKCENNLNYKLRNSISDALKNIIKYIAYIGDKDVYGLSNYFLTFSFDDSYPKLSFMIKVYLKYISKLTLHNGHNKDVIDKVEKIYKLINNDTEKDFITKPFNYIYDKEIYNVSLKKQMDDLLDNIIIGDL